MTTLGYTRISTAGQDAGLQIDALLAAGVEPARIWSDTITGSSATGDRPEFAKLAGYAREGDTVVVWRIDRLGRSLLDVLATIDELAKRAITVRSIQDGIDPTTPTGKLLLGIFGTLAEYERSLIRERVNAGIAAAKARGVKFGPPVESPDVVAAKLAVAMEGLRSQGKSVTQAASMVGWSRSTLYRMRREHGLLASSSGQAIEPIAQSVAAAQT